MYEIYYRFLETEDDSAPIQKHPGRSPLFLRSLTKRLLCLRMDSWTLCLCCSRPFQDECQEALKISTAQLATWIKHDYGLSDSEVALFLGVVMRYEVTELVDPEFNVVSKVPKSSLALLIKAPAI